MCCVSVADGPNPVRPLFTENTLLPTTRGHVSGVYFITDLFLLTVGRSSRLSARAVRHPRTVFVVVLERIRSNTFAKPRELIDFPRNIRTRENSSVFRPVFRLHGSLRAAGRSPSAFSFLSLALPPLRWNFPPKPRLFSPSLFASPQCYTLLVLTTHFENRVDTEKNGIIWRVKFDGQGANVFPVALTKTRTNKMGFEISKFQQSKLLLTHGPDTGNDS